jgi:hypothetical protein
MKTKFIFNDSDVGYIDPDFLDTESVDEEKELKLELEKNEE